MSKVSLTIGSIAAISEQVNPFSLVFHVASLVQSVDGADEGVKLLDHPQWTSETRHDARIPNAENAFIF